MIRKTAAAATIAIAGVLAALTITGTANAWNIGGLPNGCANTEQIATANDDANGNITGYTYAYRIVCGTSVTTITYGTNPYPGAATDPGWQASLDAFVNANYTAPVTTQATTTQAATTTGAATTAATSAGTDTDAATITALQGEVGALQATVAQEQVEIAQLQGALAAAGINYATLDPALGDLLRAGALNG